MAMTHMCHVAGSQRTDTAQAREATTTKGKLKNRKTDRGKCAPLSSTSLLYEPVSVSTAVDDSESAETIPPMVAILVNAACTLSGFSGVLNLMIAQAIAIAVETVKTGTVTALISYASVPSVVILCCENFPSV